MNEQQRYLLKANKKAIGDDLRPEDIFSYLQSKFVLDVEDAELIKDERTSRRRTGKLLDFLSNKGSEAFTHFYDALRDAGYEHLAALLTSGIEDRNVCVGSDDSDDEMPSVETILREGGVPKRPRVHTERPTEIKKLRDALYALQKTDGWVLLHGMAGSGKTVLAAEALEDGQLLHDCFPGGVFWVTIGVVDASRLLMKMQNLCAWLDPDRMHPVPRNVEEARDRMRILFAHEHPRALLVLDDLWSKDDARYFDVRARTLATSRNDFITDNITGFVKKVHIEEEFTEDQSKSVLSKWTNLNISSLPKEAIDIIKECKGSPLAISMIGALLKGHANRWEYYLKQIKESKVSKLKSKLAYDYPNLCEAIAVSVNSLPNDIREKYMYFAVFEEDSRVPASVLGLLWNEDEIEVEDTMDELISRSLARRHAPSKEDQYEAYSVHDLQLDFLKETCTLTAGNKDLSQRHKVLVEMYSQRCGGDFALIEDDGYVYWNIINHMIHAKMVDKAVELLLSFKWIEAKLRATGAPDLINNYHSVLQLVRNEVKDELREYVHFISINSYLLSTPGKQEYDLLQLALAQPYVSRVHLTAKRLATTDSSINRFYVGWCNKPDDSSETCLLTVQHHTGPVYCCDWSRDKSDRIVSCGGDTKAKIWHSCTGKLLLSLEGHTDIVYSCQFSPDAKTVVTSSADKSIKVWNAETGKPIFTLKGHTSDVYSSSFKPTDNHVIATCSADKTIKIWDISAGALLDTFHGHEDTVNWCCFSPDGKRIASASNDLTLKVWDISCGECLFTSCGDKDFISHCSYHPSGKKILATSQNYLQYLDAADGKPLRTIQTSCSVLSIAFSPDGKYAVGTHADSTAQLWNVEAEVCMGIFRGHSGWLHSVCFSQDGERIVTASTDETCKVWRVEPVEDRAVKLRKVFDVIFNAENQSLIVAANTNHEIQVIDGANGTFVRKTAPLGSKVTMCRFSGDGSMIIVGLQTGHFKMIETSSCIEVASFIGHYAAVTGVAMSTEGSTIVTYSEDALLKVWDLKAQMLRSVCEGHTGAVTKSEIFRNNTSVVSSSFDGTVKHEALYSYIEVIPEIPQTAHLQFRPNPTSSGLEVEAKFTFKINIPTVNVPAPTNKVWDLITGQCKFTCHHNDDNAVLSCAASQDNQLIVSTSAGSTAKIWSALTGDLLHTLQGHADCVRCAAFSPDCKLVATGSDDSTVKLWDTKTGQETARCEKHKVWVTDVHFSADGSRLVSISNDIKWWKPDGTLLQTFLIRGNFLRQIKISHDFNRFTTIDDSGQLYILDAI